MSDVQHPKHWQTLSEGPVEDHFVLGLQHMRRRSPRTGQAGDYVVLRSAPWVNVIALTPDEHVVLVKQYRHGVDGLTLEIPGGLVDPEETPEAAAIRELREETGYGGDVAIKIGEVDSNPALFDNQTHTYFIGNAKRVGAITQDDGEDIVVLTAPLAEIPAMIARGEIKHSLVVAAFYHLNHHLNRESP